MSDPGSVPPPQPSPPDPTYAPTAASMPAMPPQPPAPSPAPAPTTGGRQIGKYVIQRELGRGGMGAVYLAEQPGLGRQVAIKELILNSAADPTALTRFLQEAQVMARTSHPNLVQVFDMEQVGAANYIILEFIKGKSLRDMLSEARIPMPRVFAIMHGVLQGLNYAHRHNIVHRDMKPENVLVADEGDVKVADFGIARLTDDSGGSTATKTGTTVGTPQYMSPEQVSTSKVDGRSDLYSAGIMLYELVCGRPPFTATEADGPFTLMAKHVQAPPPPPAIHRPDIDPELEEVILKALAKRPEDRFQTGQEFDTALTHVADRVCPGWQMAMEPGADISKMMVGPGASPAPFAGYAATAPSMPSAMAPGTGTGAPVAPAAGPIPPPPASTMQRVPIANSTYNPQPPAKEGGAKKAASSCLGVLVLALGALAGAGLLVAAAVH